MALKRNNKTVVKVKEVTADIDKIASINIDFQNSLINIEVSHGNALEDVFESVFIEKISLSDTVDSQGMLEETLTISNGAIKLKEKPSSVGMRVEHNGDFIFMGSGWEIDGKKLTFKNLEDGEIINVRYQGKVEAVSDFSDIMGADVKAKDNFSKNLENILWNKLSELGIVDGEIV